MGMWHTKCFPKSSPPTQAEIEKICNQLQLKSENSQPRGKIVTSTNSSVSQGDGNKDVMVEFRDDKNAIKVVLYSKFSPTKVSDKFTAHLKTDKPLAKIVSWTKEDHENCYRLEVKCN
jgi:hypothetical protein